MSLSKNIDFLRRLPKLNGLNGLNGLEGYARDLRPDVRSPLLETVGFGSNPGDLKMFSFVPDNHQQSPALVVVLHGCGQTASGYDYGAGWSTLAKRYGFALLMPQQQLPNNPNGCFNWFNPEDTGRDRGEACSIRQMVSRMVADHKIDTRRVFVTGLSAGGAMTSVMLATYPDVFAAGAIIAGLPYGVATNVREALSGMSQSPSRPASELGDLVRRASSHKGPWPRISVWHGSADRTVNPGNADEIVKQWLDVQGLPAAAMSQGTVDGYPRQVWWNSDGETVVESYTVTDMAHGAPLGVTEGNERYGVQGAFLIEAGISSSYHIASFFGLTGFISEPVVAQAPDVAQTTAPKQTTEKPQLGELARIPDLAETLRPLTTVHRRPEHRQDHRRRAIDVGAVITRALTAAGLMK